MPGADKDLVKPLHTRIAKRYEAIMLKTKVTKIEATKAGLKVTFEGEQAPAEAQVYDKVLMAVGRRPNGREIAAEAAGRHRERARFHSRGQTATHQRAAHLRHRRHRRRPDAGTQGSA